MTDSQLQKFLTKIHRHDCWNWIGAKNDDGYGYFGIEGRAVAAHRVAYQHWKGDLIVGYQIDHLCRNRGCVNPDHLEQVTKKVNDSRRQIKVKTHCKNGHVLPDRDRYGKRRCKICAIVHLRKYRQKGRIPNIGRGISLQN